MKIFSVLADVLPGPQMASGKFYHNYANRFFPLPLEKATYTSYLKELGTSIFTTMAENNMDSTGVIQTAEKLQERVIVASKLQLRSCSSVTELIIYFSSSVSLLCGLKYSCAIGCATC